MNEKVSFESFLNAFEAQAAELNRLSQSISKISSGLTDRPQSDRKAFSDRACSDGPTHRASASIDESTPFTCFNYVAEDQAQSLATELKALNLDPATSRSVIDAMKRHLFLGIRSYLGSSNTNGSAMSPTPLCPCLLPHSSSLSSECASSASYSFLPGKRLSADLPVPSPSSACAYPFDPIIAREAAASESASKLRHSFPPRDGYRGRAVSAQRPFQLRSCPSPSAESCGQSPPCHYHYHLQNPPWVDQQRRPSSALYSICASAPSGVPCAPSQVPTAKVTSSMLPKGALLQLRRRCELGRANERYSALSESSSPPGTRSPSVSIPRYRAGESVVLCGPPCASQLRRRATSIVHCPCKSPHCPLSPAKQELLAGNAVVRRGFQKLAACFRGKLTRDMFLTEKVSTLIRTIKDTAKIALSLYLESAPDTAAGDPQEQPRTLPPAEAELEARLNVQLRAGLRQLNEIFIQWPVGRRLTLLRNSPAWRKNENTKIQRTKSSVLLPVSRLVAVARRQFSESVLPRAFRRRGRPTSIASPKIASGDSTVAGRATNVASPRRTISLPPPPPTGLHPRLLGQRPPHALPVYSGGDAQHLFNPTAALQRHPFASARTTATPRYQSRPRWQPSVFDETPAPPRPIELLSPPTYADIAAPPVIRRRKVIRVSARDRPRALLGAGSGGGKRGNSPGKQQRGLSAGNRLNTASSTTARGGASGNRGLGNGKSVRPVTTARFPQAGPATASTAEQGVLTEPVREFSALPRDTTPGPGAIVRHRFPHFVITPQARSRSKSASPVSRPSTVRQRLRLVPQEGSQSGVGSNQSNAVILSSMDRFLEFSSVSDKPIAPWTTKTQTAVDPESQISEATCPPVHDTGRGDDIGGHDNNVPVMRRIVFAKPRQHMVPKWQAEGPSIPPAQASAKDNCAQLQREQQRLNPSNNVPVVSADDDPTSSSTYRDQVLRLTWSMESCTVPFLLRASAESPSSMQLECI